jgi:hypothetical protein
MEISSDYLNRFTVNEKQNDSYELRKQISLLVERPIGQIGDFPYSRTLYQIKEVQLDNRKQYDSYISFSLALIANQKIKRITQTQEVQKFGNPFKRK